MKNIFELMLDELERMQLEVNESCAFVPQLAIAISSENLNPIFKPEVNNKESERCFVYDWQKEKKHSHAEYKLLVNNQHEILTLGENSIDLIITSHPCDNCLKKLCRYDKQIRNVLYLYKGNRQAKIDAYNLWNKKEKSYEEMSINFQLFDINLWDEDSKDDLNKVLKVLKGNLIKRAYGFIKKEIVDNPSNKRYHYYAKDEIRNKLDFIYLFEEANDIKIHSIKQSKIIIDIEKVKMHYRNNQSSFEGVEKSYSSKEIWKGDK